ncbi:MAG TPA: acyloxyacyl hydrolase [Terriglobales bacterium]|nr:acyloxyacyl hydrolase [Terriglobales bacterium]
MKTLVVVLLLGGCITIAQEAPEKGGHEIQLWAGGGHSVAGGTRNTGVFNAGLRYGWVLTNLHGPVFLKGNFEYAIDAVPVFLVFQPANTAYGIGLSPFALKWNFAPRGSWVPYFELGGGTLFTNHDVPTRTSSINFTPGAALGLHHLGNKITWSLEARYMHISNAGLTRLNPGLNTVQIRLGFGRFGK